MLQLVTRYYSDQIVIGGDDGEKPCVNNFDLFLFRCMLLSLLLLNPSAQNDPWSLSNIVVAWHDLRGRQRLFHSGGCLHLNFFTSPREVRTRLCLFCHHQIGEDCWDS